MSRSFFSFHNWAFPKPEVIAGIDDSAFETAPYYKGLRTDGVAVTKYTMGDTRYQPEQAIVKNALTALPSRVSKRYSPQNREQNTGFVLPPEPLFMKSNNSDRITTIKEYINQSQELVNKQVDTSDNVLIPGVDFARTHADAAAMLERLGMPVTKEAHYSAVISGTAKRDGTNPFLDVAQNTQAVQNTPQVQVEPIVVDRTVSLQTINMNTGNQIVVNNVPDKTYDNLNMVPVGLEADITQINTNIRQTNKPEPENASMYLTTSRRTNPNNVKTTDVFLDEAILSETEYNIQNAVNETQSTQQIRQSRNVVNVVEMHNRKNDISNIERIEDVQEILRKTADDFVEMKERQKSEQIQQMEVIEQRISKTVQPEQADDDMNEPLREIKMLIREVVESHPNLMQRNIDSPDMEFSLAARDVFLRSQIERELREKFEHNLKENNKVMEKKVALIFEDMIQKFINP